MHHARFRLTACWYGVGKNEGDVAVYLEIFLCYQCYSFFFIFRILFFAMVLLHDTTLIVMNIFCYYN